MAGPLTADIVILPVPVPVPVAGSPGWVRTKPNYRRHKAIRDAPRPPVQPIPVHDAGQPSPAGQAVDRTNAA
jgi:hypothetical protein